VDSSWKITDFLMVEPKSSIAPFSLQTNNEAAATIVSSSYIGLTCISIVKPNNLVFPNEAYTFEHK
jgi:hypothetical protein